MWHSQDRVWNLMDRQANKKYKRVAMLRLDVIYATPIDVYKVPIDLIPEDYNDSYLRGLRKPENQPSQKPVEYFYDYLRTDKATTHCVLPAFKSFPVNDRFFLGPYEAVEIWAKDRFSRARKHVTEVLPALEALRQEQQKQQGQKDDEVMKMTDYGLHDEQFVARTILPEIRKLGGTGDTDDVKMHVDRALYFLRVRADGSIWMKDKPGFGRVKKPVLKLALGRPCTGDPYKVLDPVLKAKSPGLWQIKCPP
mmetsp:Transcript_3073/g.6842  ORF Transcript_3073/g.6842 Transcript_3073/m.6842 type:complete len:252 (+) Transcript_3073:182-937(+)